MLTQGVEDEIGGEGGTATGRAQAGQEKERKTEGSSRADYAEMGD